MMEVSAGCALLIGAVACITDLRTRRIPNRSTFRASAAALLFHGVVSGPWGALWAVAGWTLGVALFFMPFALGGMGGGDVKLLGTLGAWLGASQTIWLALYTGVTGGIFALCYALYKGY